MTALSNGFWLAMLGPLLLLPPLRRRFWDMRVLARTPHKEAK